MRGEEGRGGGAAGVHTGCEGSLVGRGRLQGRGGFIEHFVIIYLPAFVSCSAWLDLQCFRKQAEEPSRAVQFRILPRLPWLFIQDGTLLFVSSVKEEANAR